MATLEGGAPASKPRGFPLLNCYLVVISTTGAHAPLDRLQASIAPTLLRNVPFVPQRVTIHRHSRWPLLLFAAELKVEGLGGARTHVDAGSLLVMDGLPLTDGLLPAPGNIAEQFGSVLDRVPVSSLPGKLVGGWSVVSCSDEELLATADVADSAPLYWGRKGGVLAVSNRATLASLALSEGRGLPVNLVNLAEQVCFRAPLDLETRFEGVRLLDPGRILRHRWGHEPSVSHGDWVPGVPDPELSAMDEDDRYDLAFSALCSQWEALARLALPVIPCAITGGRDSRASLAGAVGAGVVSAVGAFTWGLRDSPEVEVADVVCERVGVARHEVENRSIIEAGPERLWKRIEIHSWLYEGMVSAWDGLVEPLAGDGDVTLMVTGFAGDMHRRHLHAPADGASANAMREFVLDLRAPIDRFCLLRPEWREAIVTLIDDRIARYETLPLARGSFGSLAYLESRLAQWARRVGAGRIEQQRYSPLAHPTIFDINLLQSDQDRLDCRLHFELLRRGGREFVETPFLKFEWSDRIRSLHPDLRLPGPAQTSARPSSRALVGHKFRLYDEDHERVASFLLDDPGSVLFDLVSRERLEGALGPGVNGPSPAWVQTCYSLISIKMAVESGGRVQPHVLGSGRTELVTNIPGLTIDTDRNPSTILLVGHEQESQR